MKRAWISFGKAAVSAGREILSKNDKGVEERVRGRRILVVDQQRHGAPKALNRARQPCSQSHSGHLPLRAPEWSDPIPVVPRLPQAR